METKLCKRCEGEYPLTLDYFYKSKKTGYWQSYCKSCWRGVNHTARFKREGRVQIVYLDMSLYPRV